MYFKVIILSLLISVILFAGSAGFAMGQIPKSPIKAIDFTLTDINGKSHTLSAYKDKIVMLNFWASWCPPCREEMPSMQKMYDNWDKNKFILLAVNVDEGREKVKEFAKKNSYTFPILIDSDRMVSKKYEVSGIPTTYLIDEKGRILQRVVGSRHWSSEEIQRMIKK